MSAPRADPEQLGEPSPQNHIASLSIQPAPVSFASRQPAAHSGASAQNAPVKNMFTASSSSAPVFPIPTLPVFNPPNVSSRIGDLIEAYPKDRLYTGRDPDYQSLSRFQQAYTSKCSLFNLTDREALRALIVAIDEQSPAGEYF